MKKLIALSLGLAAGLVPGLALAQQRTGINNETVCGLPGYGMDQRCVGETNAGVWTDFFGSDQSRPIIIIRRPVYWRRY